MATYKVIQDIEAEDKFLGPLTLKQFIFGAIGVSFGWLNFFAYAKGAPALIGLFSPPMFLGFFLAIPWSKDQPTEVWVLAKLRFRFLAKKKVWDQSGLEELVTITVPKRIEKRLTNNINQDEVKSRLKALAETIDTRGWAVKHSSVDPGFNAMGISDRLVSPMSLPQDVPSIDLATMPDVMDDGTAVSNNFDHMIHQSEELRMQQNLNKMEQIRQGVPLDQIQQPEIRFTPPPTNYQMPVQQVSSLPIRSTADEQLLTSELKAKQEGRGGGTNHMHTLAPYNPYAVEPAARELATSQGIVNSQFPDNDQAQASMPTPSSPAIMNLAQNDDLNIATIARQAKKAEDAAGNEVVISLR